MRNTYRILIGKYFCQTAFEYRTRHDLTQAKMAEKLCMDERSYIDLEHGKSGCSMVTLVLYLVFECPDVNAFVRELREILENAWESAAKMPVFPR